MYGVYTQLSSIFFAPSKYYSSLKGPHPERYTAESAESSTAPSPFGKHGVLSWLCSSASELSGGIDWDVLNLGLLPAAVAAAAAAEEGAKPLPVTAEMLLSAEDLLRSDNTTSRFVV